LPVEEGVEEMVEVVEVQEEWSYMNLKVSPQVDQL
jgi:hypothetical protein